MTKLACQPPHTVAGSITVATMRILIVEDEPDLQTALARALRDEGYAVDTAGTGADGLFNAESVDYDAIVLDVMLPELDGWEVLTRLRKKKKTPVLMLTARDQSRDRVKGLDTGADDYVVKPFDLPELLARLRALIRRTTNQTTNKIEVGDVVIDTAARLVTGVFTRALTTGCDDKSVPDSFVVAIDRDRLPPPPYRVILRNPVAPPADEGLEVSQ